MRIIAAMSGGVDSAVAAARAVEAGHDVTGIHLALSRNPASYRTGARGCCTIEDSNDARRAADVIGIPFYVWDLSDRFHEDVVEDFMDEYAAGRTPNPCLRCNEKIKFAAVLDRALALGFDAVATGHYAQLRTGDDGLIELHRAVDHGKDQSYVLGVLDQDQLAHSLFPLGDTSKPLVREEAARRGLLVADKPDSHDICFVADGDNAGWLRDKLGDRNPNTGGDIVDAASGEVLGRHEGTVAYTIGQRRGLRLGTAGARRQAALRARHRAGLRHRHRRTARRPAGRPDHRHPAALVRHRPVPARGTRRDRPAARPRCGAPRRGRRPRRRGARRDRAARPGRGHRARPGGRALRRQPRRRVRDDQRHRPLGGPRRERPRQRCRVDARHRRPGVRRGGARRPRRAARLPHVPELPGRGATRDDDRPRAGRGRRPRRRPPAGRLAAHRRPRHRPPPGAVPAGPGPRPGRGAGAGARRVRSRPRSAARGRWPRPSRSRAATRSSPTTAPAATSPRRWPRGSATTSPTCAGACPAPSGSSCRSTSPRCPRCSRGQVPTASGFGRHRRVDLPEASAALEWVLAAITEAGAEPWVHSCAPEGALVAGARRRARAACPSTSTCCAPRTSTTFAEALEAGTTVALGDRAVDRPGERPDATRRSPSGCCAGSTCWGSTPRRPAGRLVVTPACGLAGASYDWARQALHLSGVVAGTSRPVAP